MLGEWVARLENVDITDLSRFTAADRALELLGDPERFIGRKREGNYPFDILVKSKRHVVALKKYANEFSP